MNSNKCEARLRTLRQEVEVGLNDIRAGRVTNLALKAIKREGRRRLRSRTRRKKG